MKDIGLYKPKEYIDTYRPEKNIPEADKLSNHSQNSNGVKCSMKPRLSCQFSPQPLNLLMKRNFLDENTKVKPYFVTTK